MNFNVHKNYCWIFFVFVLTLEIVHNRDLGEHCHQILITGPERTEFASSVICRSYKHSDNKHDLF